MPFKIVIISNSFCKVCFGICLFFHSFSVRSMKDFIFFLLLKDHLILNYEIDSGRLLKFIRDQLKLNF